MADPIVPCPFELAHSCKQSRLQRHLIKCRKNHPESKLEPCPYNATEYIHPDDLIEHLKVCTKAKLLEGQKYNAELLKENYLDAPFHIPKPKVEAEDFENQEIHLRYDDEQVLERSVSQMSLNSVVSVKSFGRGCDDPMSNSKTPITPSANNRVSLDLGSRASTLRSVGRGNAMAGLISVLQQIDEMDYTKYEIRSTVSDNKPEPEDPDFAPPSTFGPVRHNNISLFEKQPEQDESNFEDCSSDEELETCDNASNCSSESTIIENNRQRQNDSTIPKLSDCPRFVSDSDDDDISEVNSNNVAVTLNSDSRCTSTLSQNSVSNRRESSSSRSSFLSLIVQNKLQNDFIIRKMEGRDERSFGQGKPSSRGWNHSFTNHDRYCKPVGSHPSSAGFRDSMWNSSRNSPSVSSNFSNNRGGPLRYPQSKQNNHQNFHNQEQFSHSTRNNRTNNFDQARGRGSFNKVNSVGRGYNQLSSSGDGDSFRTNSVGRGNFPNQHCTVGRGNSFKENSVGRGNFHSQGNTTVSRGSFNKQNFIGRGNIYNQGDMPCQANSVGRGNILNQGDVHSQEHFVGRGKHFMGKSFNDQNNSMGRGNLQNHSQSFSCGSPFPDPGSNSGAEKSVGRGNVLMKFMSQNPGYRSNWTQQNGSHTTTNSFVDPENFRGKSSPKISLQVVYNTFKDLQISDCSPPKSHALINKIETQGPLAGDCSVGSRIADPITSTTLAPEGDTSCVPKKNKPKKKKKKKSKQTPSNVTVVDSSAQLESNMEGSKPTPCVVDSSTKPKSNTETPLQTSNGPSFKILNKNMDPKKYFSHNINSRADCKKNASTVDLKSDEAVPKSASSNFDSKTNTFKKGKKANFKIYDQFYQNMTLTPSNNQVCTNFNQNKQNKFHSKMPTANFSERFEKEQRQTSPQKVYASVNCIQVSDNPVQPFSQNNIPTSSNIPPNVSFASLHSPQKLQVPRRYDRLSETASYNFVFRHLQKKKVFVNRKCKPASQFRKMPNPPSVNVSQLQVVPGKKVNNIASSIGYSEIGPEQCKKNLKFKNKKKAKASVKNSTSQLQVENSNFKQSHVGNEISLCNTNFNASSVNISQVTAESSSKSNRPIDSSRIEPKQYKNNLNSGNKRGAKTSFNKQQFQMHNNNFQEGFARNEMSLWNRNSYDKINSSESRFNFTPKSQMNQKRTFNASYVPNVYPKKHSFAVPKKNPTFTQRGHFSKNTNFREPQQRPHYPNNRFISNIFSNSFSQPLAFGPSLSSHLLYSARSPNDSFDLS